MEIDGFIIIGSLCALGVWLAVWYYIILNAVSSALKQNDYYNKCQMRFAIKKMEKEGFTKQEIVNIMDWSEEDFWDSISGEVKPEEKLSYLDEMKKQLK